MGRWKSGDAAWREDHRKISTCVSLPKYIIRDLKAQGVPSVVLTKLCEINKTNIGEGVYRDAIVRRKECIALIVEDMLKERLPDMIRSVVQEAVDRYIAEAEKEPKIRASDPDNG